MKENKAFTERLVNRLQKITLEDPFAMVGTDYLFQHNRLKYDMEKNLFWIAMPNESFQIAVWMVSPTEEEKQSYHDKAN